MPRPSEETYDRRHLARVPHVIELRDRSLRDVKPGQYTYDVPEVRYNNRLIAAYPACRKMGCWSALTTRAGFTESGVDVFVGHVAVEPGRYVSVAPLKGDGPHVCANCGDTITI